MQAILPAAEFTAVVAVVIYLPLSTNVKRATSELYDTTSEQETGHPEAFFLAAGDFN